MKTLYIILITLIFHSCMSKNNLNDVSLKQPESEAIFLLEQITQSIKLWKSAKMPKACMPSIDSGFMEITLNDFSKIKVQKLQAFVTLEKNRNKKIIELLVIDKNDQSIKFSIEVLSFNGLCVSYEIHKIIQS